MAQRAAQSAAAPPPAAMLAAPPPAGGAGSAAPLGEWPAALAVQLPRSSSTGQPVEWRVGLIRSHEAAGGQPVVCLEDLMAHRAGGDTAAKKMGAALDFALGKLGRPGAAGREGLVFGHPTCNELSSPGPGGTMRPAQDSKVYVTLTVMAKVLQAGGCAARPAGEGLRPGRPRPPAAAGQADRR